MNTWFLFLLSVCLILFTNQCFAFFGDLLKDISQKASPTQSDKIPDEKSTVSALKEALSIGSTKAVSLLSKADGYFLNEAVKILLPEGLQKVADTLSMLGYKKQTDAFIMSMNRAAEKAAIKAKPIFMDAIKAMTFEDALKILKGNDTAATDYFKGKTSQHLYNEFKPIISNAMAQVGVTKKYQDMTASITTALPMAISQDIDLDHYVTTKALDGIFYMIALEEKNIRNNPSARVTELLRNVFSR